MHCISVLICAVPVQVHGLTVSMDDAQFRCLLEGHTAILTCHVSGLPRPRILFNRAGMNGLERITTINYNQVCDVNSNL